MRLSATFIFLLVTTIPLISAFEHEDDNEFADFDFEVEGESENEVPKKNNDEKPSLNQQQNQQQEQQNDNSDSFNDGDDDEGIVEDEFDQDEFEGFGGEPEVDERGKRKNAEPKLKIMNKVPYNKVLWHNYWIEMLFLSGLVLYFFNYAMGKNKNIKIANSWLTHHRQLLEENFALVGDDSNTSSDPQGFIKESDSVYSLWCSGRTLVEGMLVELKLIKRQDLLSITMGLLKKVSDQVQIKVELSKDSMDSFVFALCNKKSAGKLFKDMIDLKQYCVNVAKADEKYSLPSGFSLLSEIGEASSAIIDSKLLTMLSKYSQNIESLHISDQYSGLSMQDQDPQMAKPEIKKMLILTYSFNEKTDFDDLKPLLQLVIYLVEKLKRFRLSREGKSKADKNRQRVEEEYLKNTHQSRMEAAALKKEEKRKLEKEKMMNEENEEKQIKLERKMKRKDAKKAMPKMKSMNIHL